VKKEKFATYIRSFDFHGLFINEMGWDNYSETIEIEAENQKILLRGFAEKKSFPLFECVSNKIPDRSVMQTVERKLSRMHPNHLIIWMDTEKTVQLWQVPVIEANKPKRLIYPRWYKNQDTESLYQRFGGAVFSLKEEVVLTLFDVLTRVTESSAKNAETVVKKFYTEFSKQHKQFMSFIT
jgi:hypothetical protein